jgi:NodT family efflux transporter outer membrane factor (OMF) lipoprotein
MHHSLQRLALIPLLLLGACSLWPEYEKPVVAIPQAFKQADAVNGWKTGQPGDEQLRTAWWESYQDAQLNSLVTQAINANQNLVLAEANFRRAAAASSVNRSALWPTVTANGSATRAKRSTNAVRIGADPIIETYNLSLNASWEPDIWGRIRKQIESGDALLQASKADIEVSRLSLIASLAQEYFQLRVLDTQLLLLDDTLKALDRSKQVTLNRYRAGVATKTDVNQADALHKNTLVVAAETRLQRAQSEHAIALLLGKAPAELNIAANPFNMQTQLTPPAVPVSLPAALLERRPDISAAERRVAAANAEIGIAKTAYFPSLNLTAGAGYQSNAFSNLISTPSRIWSIGPLIALNVFDGGLRKAQTDAAIAGYDATVAQYRQTVLTAFQEVEDQLAAISLLSEQAGYQQAAIKASSDALQESTNRYKAGTLDYLNVITWQTNTLNNQRNLIAIHGRQLQASVALVRAIGGGWSNQLNAGSALNSTSQPENTGGQHPQTTH